MKKIDNLPSFPDITEHLSSLHYTRDPKFNYPPLEYSQDKNYWKLLSKAIITPFAPKHNLFSYQKYLKKTHIITSNSSLQSIITPSQSFRGSDSKIEEIPLKREKTTFMKEKPLKKRRRNFSFIVPYEDLLTKLDKPFIFKENKTSNSFNSIGLFEKIKPKLRSYLILSAPKKPSIFSDKKPLFFNKMALEIRRKSCGCSICGGFCLKVQKSMLLFTDKEKKTIIQNHSKIPSFLLKNKENNIKRGSLVEKRTFIEGTPLLKEKTGMITPEKKVIIPKKEVNNAKSRLLGILNPKTAIKPPLQTSNKGFSFHSVLNTKKTPKPKEKQLYFLHKLPSIMNLNPYNNSSLSRIEKSLKMNNSLNKRGSLKKMII